MPEVSDAAPGLAIDEAPLERYALVSQGVTTSAAAEIGSIASNAGGVRSTRGRVELAREVLELAPQLLVLEDLIEGRRLEPL